MLWSESLIYTWDGENRLIVMQTTMPAANATALSGYDFAWTYDDIGNRKTAVANGQTSTYTPNNLNQYASRTIPGAFDVLAAAEPAATVTYQFPWDTGVPTTLSRFGDLLYKGNRNGVRLCSL